MCILSSILIYKQNAITDAPPLKRVRTRTLLYLCALRVSDRRIPWPNDIVHRLRLQLNMYDSFARRFYTCNKTVFLYSGPRFICSNFYLFCLLTVVHSVDTFRTCTGSSIIHAYYDVYIIYLNRYSKCIW